MDNLLAEFFFKGELGSIRLSAQKNNVLGMFREPDDILINEDLELYKFNDLEITFQSEHVVIINIEIMDNKISLPKEFKIHNGFSGKNLEEMLSDLGRSEIGWEICKEKSYGQTLAVVTEAGVILYYELAIPELSKIQLSSFSPNYYSAI